MKIINEDNEEEFEFVRVKIKFIKIFDLLIFIWD